MDLQKPGPFLDEDAGQPVQQKPAKGFEILPPFGSIERQGEIAAALGDAVIAQRLARFQILTSRFVAQSHASDQFPRKAQPGQPYNPRTGQSADDKSRQDHASTTGERYFLRWRMRDRMRRFLRPSLRRPRPVFLTPTIAPFGCRDGDW